MPKVLQGIRDGIGGIFFNVETAGFADGLVRRGRQRFSYNRQGHPWGLCNLNCQHLIPESGFSRKTSTFIGSWVRSEHLSGNRKHPIGDSHLLIFCVLLSLSMLEALRSVRVYLRKFGKQRKKKNKNTILPPLSNCKAMLTFNVSSSRLC